ncbi:retrotransposon protein, putative, ty1-copia subclass [Tanacetum coccineum]
MTLMSITINHSAFRSIFERENIFGLNYNDWFRSPKMVLRVEKKLFVIEQPISAASPADSKYLRSNAVYDAHNEELKSMFEKQVGVERFDLIQTFHVCKQEEGKLVGPYIIKIKNYVAQLEGLGYVLPQDLSVGLILNGLTIDFADLGVRKLKQVEAIGSFDIVLPNGLLTPPYTPQHNGVSERRNRTLLDMVRSMMNLTTLPLSFWDYAFRDPASTTFSICFNKMVDMIPKGNYGLLFQLPTREQNSCCENPEAELQVDCYCNAGFETDRDEIKSQTGYVFILNERCSRLEKLQVKYYCNVRYRS